MGNHVNQFGVVGTVGTVGAVGTVGFGSGLMNQVGQAGRSSMHASWSQVLDQWEAGNGPLLPVDQPFIWRCTPVDTALRLKYAHQIVPKRLSSRANPSKLAERFDGIDGQYKTNKTNKTSSAVGAVGTVGAVGVVAFPSSASTMLVAPMPVWLGRHVKNYAHMQLFLINASQAEHRLFWQTVCRTIRQMLAQLVQNEPTSNLVWTSVHNSVNWLHVRVSTKPKYYNNSWCQYALI